jgi:hypothetical protein
VSGAWLVGHGRAFAKRGASAYVPAMPERTPPPEDLSTLSLEQIAALVAERRLPPVESWQPQQTGDSAMRIARDGSWYHEGGLIRRPAMVRLFSTILRREPDGGFALVTPVEKLSIEVEDAPFTAVEMKQEGQGRDARLAFRLNSGDMVIAGARHPLRMELGPEGAQPYLQVRRGLDALLVRSVYYELAELALGQEGEPPGVWSDGVFFRLEGGA